MTSPRPFRTIGRPGAPTDEEIGDPIAYLRSQPAIKHEVRLVMECSVISPAWVRFLQVSQQHGDIYFVKQALGHSHVTITERYLKFPLEYLQQVFGESITPYHADQRWANLGESKPAFQA